jgi:GT2 family glycosyltransferase
MTDHAEYYWRNAGTSSMSLTQVALQSSAVNSQAEPDPVDASIVVIAWRLTDELRECLDSISSSVDAPPHEVIVVLNGASPEVESVVAQHAAVTRMVRRSANIGFGAACNLGAHVAAGRNVIFLNDDARVEPFWLKAITEAADEDPQRFAVASLLLNFDGTVQEAGSRVLQHGGTVQLAKGLTIDESHALGAMESRRIDYGSAAALLVNRQRFEAAGGFDPLFEPAYFEDVDLQFRLREMGGYVWLESEARVRHHSGRSTQSDHWFRHFAAARSGYRFVERWGKVLATAPAADDPVREICTVRPRSRAVGARAPIDPAVDDSPTIALAIAHGYQEWLAAEVDRLHDLHAEILADPSAPSRRQLINRVQELTDRLSDLEKRGPVGVLRMRIGLWSISRRKNKQG